MLTTASQYILYYIILCYIILYYIILYYIILYYITLRYVTLHYIMTKKSNNKCKTSWDIIKKLSNNHRSHPDMKELTIDSKHLKYKQDIADAFNNHFLSIIDNISNNNVNNQNNSAKVPQYYLEQNYVHPPPSLVIKTFSTKAITSIIKALKTKNLLGFDGISVKLLRISATYVHH